MLYCLQPDATVENWLYESLHTAFLASFAAIDTGEEVTPWLDFVPDAHRTRLKRRKLLGASIVAVIDGYRHLSGSDRALLREALDDQRQLTELFNGNRAALCRDLLPLPMQPLVAEYAERAFTTLEELGIKSRSYAIHSTGGYLACAFCGYEAYDSSRVRNMDWDHYLARSLYPFVSANLRNLSPMGDACNRNYKGSKDVLRSNNGMRRRCFDPYGSQTATVDLLGSRLFARGRGNVLPEWNLTITGDPDACATWDSIFRLRERWNDRLDEVHASCLKFVGGTMRRSVVPADQDILDRLQGYAHGHRAQGSAAGTFLERAVYELWATRCAQGGEEADRLFTLFKRSVAERGRA